MEASLLDLLGYTLPSVVTGGVAYTLFKGYLQKDLQLEQARILQQKKKEGLPIKLQAYERLMLYCDRIRPNKLLLRVPPVSPIALDYLELLTATIEQEYEHNMVQQIYVSDTVWKGIISTKQILRTTLAQLCEGCETAEAFRTKVLEYFSQKDSPSEVVIGLIKNDIRSIL